MTAVIFVDVQNDFIDGKLKNPLAQAVLPKIIEYAKTLVAWPRPEYRLYATMDTHGDNYASTLEGSKIPPHCIEGTDGWRLAPELDDVLQGNATYIPKPHFGSYDELVGLIAEDQELHGKFDEIILVGFCTSICVASNATLLRTKFPDTKITVLKDLCACVSEETHNAALKVLEMQLINVA